MTRGFRDPDHTNDWRLRLEMNTADYYGDNPWQVAVESPDGERYVLFQGGLDQVGRLLHQLRHSPNETLERYAMESVL